MDLSSVEQDRFLEALIRLKHRPVPNGPAGVSVYDQFVALHGAVFAVLAPGLPPGGTVNFGHWNIGFCAWHRKYLREFEKALQAEVGSRSPIGTGAATSARSGRSSSPSSWGRWEPAPPRWPAASCTTRSRRGAAGLVACAGAEGFPIHRCWRPSSAPRWPGQRRRRLASTVAGIQQLEQLVVQQPGVHLLVLRLVLEQGHQQVTSRTHNRGHNFIGGHMSTGFSPNDPVFCSTMPTWTGCGRTGRRAASPRSPAPPQDHYPPPAELSPLDGDPAPPGHRLDDQMWPWVGAAPGFDVEIDPAVKPLLPDFSGVPAVTVREMLQTETVDPEGYRYAAPGQPWSPLHAATSAILPSGAARQRCHEQVAVDQERGRTRAACPGRAGGQVGRFSGPAYPW